MTLLLYEQFFNLPALSLYLSAQEVMVLRSLSRLVSLSLRCSSVLYLSILVSGDSHDSVTGFRTKPLSFSAVFLNTCFITLHFSSTFVLLLVSNAQGLS